MLAKTPAAHSSLTEIVCWSRMQVEAGESLESIINRKELERVVGDGVFFWGVGNAPARQAVPLARDATPIDVVFSMMKTKPKQEDVAPAGLTIWRSYIDLMGCEQPLPPGCLVTSRSETTSKTKTSHFALMCYSETALQLGDHGPFVPTSYRNVSENGGEVGASQVTALVRRVAEDEGSTDYRINLRARLHGAYWVRLTNPTEVSPTKRTLLNLAAQFGAAKPSSWRKIVSGLRVGPAVAAASQPSLF